MSSTLGTGYVAITPINLDTVPSPREGSKAGLLTLFWSDVLRVNKSYTQPVNLLQSYQTGQFTTVQALLVDNALVAYPVAVVSRSTGQRIVVGPYTQQMVPLLVSVAPEFLISLQVPQGVVAQDAVATQFWFLNTPQTPYATTVNIPGAVLNQAASGTVSVARSMSVTWYPVTTLMSGFNPGTRTVTYQDITATVTNLTPFIQDTTIALRINQSLDPQQAGGADIVWTSVAGSGVSGSNGLVLNTQYTFSPSPPVTNTSGNPIVLQIAQGNANGNTQTLNLSVGYSFRYTMR